MESYTGTLNEAQMAVLKWIADGCPDGALEGYEHRVSAAALRSRDLVRISGRGKTWRAEITDRGRDFLARSLQVRTKSADTQSRSGNLEAEANGGPAPPKPAPARQLSPSEQLVADVIAAGGVLKVPYVRREGEPDYQQRLLAAERFGKVPRGKRLTSDYVAGHQEIRLEDAIEGTEVEARPVPVPERISRLHPVARRFRDDTDKHLVSRARLSRSVRIVHALATEVERRGWEISNAEGKTGGYQRDQWSPTNDGHFVVTIRSHSFGLRVFEEKVKARGAFEAETRSRASARFPQYLPPRKLARYDSAATGRLQIAFVGYGHGGRTSTFSDRKNWTLEEKLAELFRELEIRAAKADHRQAEMERAAEERRRRWEVAMDQARERFFEAHREQVLRAQISAWQEVGTIRSFLEALEAKYGDNPDSADWIAWIKGYLDERLDPLASPPTMPARPDATPDDLKPFLSGGLSPYGPPSW